MTAETELVYEVGKGEFEERVIFASSERVIVADFWAPWCAPCRMLSPILEKAVKSFGGAMALAKVNIDSAPDLAARYGIRGIPAVKVFRNGEVVAEFVGLKPEGEIREVLSQLVPSEADDLAARGQEVEGSGHPQEAEPLYRQALAQDPGHSGALLGLARLRLGRGDLDAARQAASRVAEDSSEREAAEALLARLRFMKSCAQRGGTETVEKAAADQPGDLDALYGYAECLAAAEQYKQALATFLRILERDKRYGEGAARDAMVRIFGIVGQRSPLANDYRSRLARVLY